MEELQLLKSELYLLLDNIERVEKRYEEEKSSKYVPYNIAIVGELKHRCVALKQRLTNVNNLSTNKMFRNVKNQ